MTYPDSQVYPIKFWKAILFLIIVTAMLSKCIELSLAF